MLFRAYQTDRDKDACLRILREVGWLDSEGEAGWTMFMESGHTAVAELSGAAECMVITHPGVVRHLADDLPLCIVAAVTTSRVARKQGCASRLTAASVAREAAAGAQVSALGMFEQGYYTRLGFGSGGYEHVIGFDPAQLTVEAATRAPRRITKDDWEAVHAARLARHRGHGAVSLLTPEFTRSEMLPPKSFGLGYYDGPDGALSHHIWFSVESAGDGPYHVNWTAYQTRDQLLELLGVIKTLGDQVRLVRLTEPQGVQLQDFIRQPFRFHRLTEGGKMESRASAYAWWQMRICDLAGCLAQTHLSEGPLRFNLRLSDPIERFLAEDAPWRGVGGEYVVALGPSSGAEPGTDSALPTLEATVSAFTRLWLGVRPATGLATSDDLRGPEGLLGDLDAVLRIPEPKVDWRF
jgi:hypothetical protein